MCMFLVFVCLGQYSWWWWGGGGGELCQWSADEGKERGLLLTFY